MPSRRSYAPSKLLIRKINKIRWITEYIHEFSPMGQPSAVQFNPIEFSPASAGMTRKWDSSGSNSLILDTGMHQDVNSSSK